jgi:predicted metal-dependent hydrolase
MLFGEILPITVVEGKKNKAEARENDLLVTLKDVNDGEARRKAISAALDAILALTVEELCQEIYPDFEDYLPHFPEIKYRHMKSRWGSCNYKKYILTFNYHLVHAPIDCIEYVVYHEFTHFIHPDHSKAFYAEVSRYVPDYKEKKNKLQSVIIDQT